MSKRQTASMRASTVSSLVMVVEYALCNTCMSVLMNQIIEEYGLVSARQGLMNSVINLGSMVAVLVVPFLQGRVKKTVMLGLSAMLQALMMAVTGFSSTFALLLFACAVMGVGGGWADSYLNSCIVDIHKENSARYMGMLHGFYGVGAIFTPLLMQSLLFFTGWRNVYLLSAIAAFLMAVQFFFVLRRHRDAFTGTVNQEKRLGGSTVRTIARDKFCLLVMACSFFAVSSQNVLFGWTVRYYRVMFNEEAIGAVAVSLIWAGATISRFLAPRLKMAPMKIVVWGAVGAFVSMMIGLFSGNMWVAFAAVGLAGFFGGPAVPILITESASRYPGNTSLPTTIFMLVTKTAMMAMPLLVGAVAAFSMRAGMLISPICSLAAVLFGVLAMAAHRREKA